MASMDHKMTFWQWGTWSFRTRACHVTHQIEFTDAERLGPGASWQRQPTNQPCVAHPLQDCRPAVQMLKFSQQPRKAILSRGTLTSPASLVSEQWFWIPQWPAPRPFDAFFTMLRYCNFIVCNKAVPETASWIWKNKNWIFASSINFQYYLILRIAATWDGPVMWPFFRPSVFRWCSASAELHSSQSQTKVVPWGQRSRKRMPMVWWLLEQLDAGGNLWIFEYFDCLGLHLLPAICKFELDRNGLICQW